MKKHIIKLKNLIAVILFALILFIAGISISSADSPPPLPNTFSGTVKSANSSNQFNAPAGILIEALIDNITKGRTVTTTGNYIIDVSGANGDDGKNITFRANNLTANQKAVFNASSPPPGTLNLIFIDNSPPSIKFISPTPTNKSNISKNWIFINISSNEPLNSAQLLWNGSYENMNGSGTRWYRNKTNLANGKYTYRIKGRDLAGNWNYTEIRVITLDTIAPRLAFVPPTPANKSSISKNWIFINITSNEPLNFVQLLWNGSYENMNGSGTRWYRNKTNLANGKYTYRVKGRDLAGNWNYTEIRVVTLDTIAPRLSFIAPTPLNGSNTSKNWVFINVTSNEPLNYARLLWNGSYENMNGSGTRWYKNKTYLANGKYTFRINGSDLAGNRNYTEIRTVTVNHSTI